MWLLVPSRGQLNSGAPIAPAKFLCHRSCQRLKLIFTEVCQCGWKIVGQDVARGGRCLSCSRQSVAVWVALCSARQEIRGRLCGSVMF